MAHEGDEGRGRGGGEVDGAERGGGRAGEVGEGRDGGPRQFGEDRGEGLRPVYPAVGPVGDVLLWYGGHGCVGGRRWRGVMGEGDGFGRVGGQERKDGVRGSMLACGDETVPGLGDVVYIVQRCRRRGLERWRLVDLLKCWSAA